MHIKDFDGESFTPNGGRKYSPPGEGHIDFVSFSAGLKKSGFTGSVSLEAPAIDEEGNVHIGKLQDSLNFIRGLIE